MEQARHNTNPARGMHRVSRLLVAWLFLWLFHCTPLAATDSQPPALEHQVKAAFLVKFASFVQWPRSTNDTSPPESFVIGILGKDPFGEHFDNSLKNEKVEGRRVSVKRASSLDELADCQIIFISTVDAPPLAETLATLAGRPVLTVSDAEAFTGAGGMIGFYKDAGRVRFEINLSPATTAGLQFSAKLLQVGKIVGAQKQETGKQASK